MGSTGKIRGGDVVRGNRPTEGVSDVDSRTTPMSDEDKQIVGGIDNWSTRYFQTATAFDINKALRSMVDKGYTIDEALSRLGKSDNTIEGIKKTIDAMDRNMYPTNKDMEVTRLAKADYAERILKDLDVSSTVINEVNNMWLKGGISEGGLKQIRDNAIGAKITESGFMSTTYNKSLNDSAFKDRRIRIDMKVAKGTNGMFSPTGQESEFVLARGTSYKINDVTFDNKDHRLVFHVSVG